MKTDKSTLALSNRIKVLATIRNNNSINKAEVARLTELSIPTAVKITDELEKNGLVCVCHRATSENRKKAPLYEFNGAHYHSIGIDISPTSIKILLMDFNGEILLNHQCKMPEQKEADAILGRVAEIVCTMVKKADISFHDIEGIGLAIPGILDIKEGIVIFSPNLHWENIAVVTSLKQKLLQSTQRLWPVTLENSNRALALAEQYFGDGVGYNYFVCINLGYGIGSAIVENEHSYVGASGSSGEIGHITVEKDGPLCTCGNKGCLEAVASGRAIALQARNLIANGVTTKIYALANNDLEQVDAKVVFEAVRQGDVAALNLLKKAGEYIGISIASYINLLDPEKIVLAGGMSKEKILIDEIERIIQLRRMRFAGRKVKIRVTRLGEYATALGAATIYLNRMLEAGGVSE